MYVPGGGRIQTVRGFQGASVGIFAKKSIEQNARKWVGFRVREEEFHSLREESGAYAIPDWHSLPDSFFVSIEKPTNDAFSAVISLKGDRIVEEDAVDDGYVELELTAFRHGEVSRKRAPVRDLSCSPISTATRKLAHGGLVRVGREHLSQRCWSCKDLWSNEKPDHILSRDWKQDQFRRGEKE